MNTLRIYALIFCFILGFQSSGAQEPAAAPEPLDLTALCAEGEAICALAQRIQQMENEVKPPCYTIAGGITWCAGDPWPPDCGDGAIWTPTGCIPIVVEAFQNRSQFIDTALITHWPWWWPKPWDIPRPPYPYPWQVGPLPDPWLEQALQQRLSIPLPAPAGRMAPGQPQFATPVLIGTDEGTVVIPDFCLVAEWEEGKIPPECSALSGLVRKLGLSPEQAPMLQAAP